MVFEDSEIAAKCVSMKAVVQKFENEPKYTLAHNHFINKHIKAISYLRHCYYIFICSKNRDACVLKVCEIVTATWLLF